MASVCIRTAASDRMASAVASRSGHRLPDPCRSTEQGWPWRELAGVDLGCVRDGQTCDLQPRDRRDSFGELAVGAELRLWKEYARDASRDRGPHHRGDCG